MSKISRYNHFFPWRDGYYLAYNARSGAVAMMTEENYAGYQKLRQLLANGGAQNLSPEEQTLLQQMEYGLFAHADTLDEFEDLKFRHRQARFNHDTLGLVIAPTMACNMACVYCFEANKKGKMSARVIEAVVDYVEKRAKKCDAVDIGWYGGEPLLALDVIGDISETMLEMAEQYKFTYTSSLITNGYLLTKETVDKLVGWKVLQAQITLDGPARIHDKQRPLKNGKPSFGTIIENLVYASTKMGIGIRVNVDKTFTVDMIAELLDEFDRAGLRERIGVYFGLTEPASTACANIVENCYETADFAGIETEFYALLLERGFRIDKIPSPSQAYCVAQMTTSFVVDPEGELYRCFNHVGDKAMSMGNIQAAPDFGNPNFIRLFKFDPFEDARCRACDLLPLCMGGCPARRADRGLDNDLICDSWKYNLQPMLEIIARSRQQALERARAAKAAEAAKETV